MQLHAAVFYQESAARATHAREFFRKEGSLEALVNELVIKLFAQKKDGTEVTREEYEQVEYAMNELCTKLERMKYDVHYKVDTY